MSDLISRQAVLDMANGWTYNFCDPEDEWAAMKEIRELPSAEPERKKGRWEHIYIKRRGYTYDDRTPRTRESAYCTACRAIVPELKKISRGDSKYRTICNVFNFCPNCGADMRGGEDETD